MNNSYRLLLFSILIIIISGKTMAQEEKNIFTYNAGIFKISLLSDGQQKGNTNILIGATPEMLQECIPDGTFPNAYNAFLVQTPDKTILVDAGTGTRLFENMQSLGVNTERVDIILITHMHGDHIGGLLIDGKAAFHNAEVYLSQPEYNYWTSDERMNQLPENRRGGFLKAREVIAAYKNKLHLFQPEEPGKEANALISGIYGIAAYGHTPGHSMYLFKSGNDQFLIWGDLAHAMKIQMPYPQVAVTYDSNPKQATDSRVKILEYVSRHNIPIAGMHIPYPAIGTVSASGNKYTFTPKQ